MIGYPISAIYKNRVHRNLVFKIYYIHLVVYCLNLTELNPIGKAISSHSNLKKNLCLLYMFTYYLPNFHNTLTSVIILLIICWHFRSQVSHTQNNVRILLSFQGFCILIYSFQNNTLHNFPHGDYKEELHVMFWIDII